MSYSLSLERFSGKVAVVTGASAGIGKAIAEGLVRYGVIVAGIARGLERLEEQAKQLSGEKGKLRPYKCDMANQEEILSTFKKITEELGPIHILVNNVGIWLGTTIIDGDIEKWKPVLDINVLGLAICTREAIRSMKTHDIKGHIINVNAGLGHAVIDIQNLSLYPASKHAVTGLTETVRLEINREKLPIKITSLSPGYVKTDLAQTAFGEASAKAIRETRPGLNAEDVADAAFYILATPEHVNVKELTVFVQEASG